MPSFVRKILRSYLSASAVLLVAVLFLSGCKGEKAVLKVGDNAPAAVLEDLGGAKLSVPGDFRGRLVVLRFWADWCKSCEVEMPALDKVHKKYVGKGLVVLAVNEGQTKEVAGDYAKRLDLSYPVLLDPDSKVAKKYGVVGLPTTMIIDRDGRLKKKIIGETGVDAMEKIVAGLL